MKVSNGVLNFEQFLELITTNFYACFIYFGTVVNNIQPAI
jgi:hypothetical protein